MNKTLYILLVLIIYSCAPDRRGADAFGNFEATNITVSAEEPGKLKALNVREGQHLDSVEYLGYIDTTALHLKKEQFRAQYRSIRSRIPEIHARIAVLKEQLLAAEREYRRFKSLSEQGATPERQVDELKDKVAVLEKQIAQARTGHEPLLSELETINSQIRQVNHRIEQAKIYAPVNGTVLVKLKEVGELVNRGTPLFRMADLDTLRLTAYISGSQLVDVQLGQEVTVRIDKGREGFLNYIGQIQRIAEEAEFTPKTIQTKEQRVDLVYAMDISVANDGRLKIGMPAEVYFNSKTER